MFVITHIRARYSGQTRTARGISLNNTCCIKVALPTRMRVIGTYLHDPWNFIFQRALHMTSKVSSHITTSFADLSTAVSIARSNVKRRVRMSCDYFPPATSEFSRVFSYDRAMTRHCASGASKCWISFISILRFGMILRDMTMCKSQTKETL